MFKFLKYSCKKKTYLFLQLYLWWCSSSELHQAAFIWKANLNIFSCSDLTLHTAPLLPLRPDRFLLATSIACVPGSPSVAYWSPLLGTSFVAQILIRVYQPALQSAFFFFFFSHLVFLSTGTKSHFAHLLYSILCISIWWDLVNWSFCDVDNPWVILLYPTGLTSTGSVLLLKLEQILQRHQNISALYSIAPVDSGRLYQLCYRAT